MGQWCEAVNSVVFVASSVLRKAALWKSNLQGLEEAALQKRIINNIFGPHGRILFPKTAGAACSGAGRNEELRLCGTVMVDVGVMSKDEIWMVTGGTMRLGIVRPPLCLCIR